MLSLQLDRPFEGECRQLVQGSKQGSALAALRVSASLPTKTETPRVRRRAFQLTAEEVRAAPNVVDGTFLMSYIPSLVLFDSGASRSFVYLAFSHHISIRCEVLIRPLRVSIADEHAVFATDVIRGCVLEIFGVEFPIDLVLIAMDDVCVIMGMDSLSQFGAMIDYERQIVPIRDPSGGVVTV